MTTLPKRLIEVDLPIRRISEHARREKSIRHGHISTLHIWWARRPLAACRAVLCASLWLDPADPYCPEAFVVKARAEMLAWTTHERQNKLSPESRERFNAARKDDAHFDDLVELRMALLDFIADFANWDNSTDAEYLATSRALTQCAHEALGGIPGTRPLVVDPFAGGGSIPLEALRVGGDAFASDLNPIPVLLNKVILEYIPKYGKRLADEVRKWGQWIKEEAEKELAEFYPKDEDGSTPIAYLWARTIISEDPGGGAVPVEVPLLRSLWLSKKANNRKALRWVRDEYGAVQCDTLEVCYASGKTIKVRRPKLEIFTPSKERDVETSTVARGSVSCPVTGYTTPVGSVRKQIYERRGSAKDSRLIAVVITGRGHQRRGYREPSSKDYKIVEIANKRILNLLNENAEAFPNEPLPPSGALGYRLLPYGFENWSDIFTARQLLTLQKLSNTIANLEGKATNAVKLLLACAFARTQDLNASTSSWANTLEAIVGANRAQNRMPMIWDFVEAAPFGDAGGNWLGQIEWVAKVVEHIGKSQLDGGAASQAPAQEPTLPEESVDILATDPPYYDAFGYSDLSDFFLCWHKRTLNLRDDKSIQFSEDGNAPKDLEVIANPEIKSPSRIKKDASWFEESMSAVFTNQHRQIKEQGVGVIVFANKSTSGWEAMLTGIWSSGWTITGSWPIDTERPARQRAQNSAALGSSVHLVVRPRITNGHEAIGDWRDVLAELPKRIHAWLPHLAEEGVVGADAIFACLGPALEIFSRYDSVEKASGELVTLREYLEQVWAAVSREALSTVVADADLSGFESDARLSAMWLWTVAAVPEDIATDSDGDTDEDGDAPKAVKTTGFTLEYDAARKISQGLGANLDDMRSIVEVKGDKATLLPVAARTEYLFGKGESAPESAKGRKKKSNQLDMFAELVEDGANEDDWEEKTVSKPGETILDRVHQAMILFASGRGEALKRFLVDDGVGQDRGLWKLAQALSALYPTGTQEKRWVDGVLARKKGLGL